MPQIIAIDTPTLGDRSYLVHDGRVAFVVDPQRDIDRVLDLATSAGVTITHIFETHIHNDHVTGGYALTEQTGAAYHVNAEDRVAFDRVGVRDGDVIPVGDAMRVRVVATPGHTFTHLLHIPLQDLPRRLDEVPQGEVWVHCEAGYRASIAASILAAGRRVVSIDDEYEKTRAAGLPLITGAAV